MTDYVMVPKALITHAQEMREYGEPTDWDSCLRDIIESAKPVSAEPEFTDHWRYCEMVSNIPSVDEAIRTLLDDQTGDNATELVREILETTSRPAQEWIKTTDRLPEKPGLEPYEYVDCYIVVDGKVLERPWNCEHECWDDEGYDDFEFEANRPSHWMPKPDWPNPPQE